jgi:dTDP-4-amino-4,6-dideoxygalactose transaminase
MPNYKTRISLATPTLHGDEQKFVQEAFDRNWVSAMGFNCEGIEAEMKAFLASGKYDSEPGNEGKEINVLSLSSGTAAIHMAVKLAGIKRGDLVFCSDMTFAATVNPISYEGGIQVFIDSESDTWNMDPKALEKAFKKYPKAKCVMLAHLYGTPSKLDEIRTLCEYYGAVLIEDAAESLSATYKGKQTGTFGNLSAISFNGNKIITASCGGMLISKDANQREKALNLATQAREKAPWYQHKEYGYNYRMSNVCAGIVRGQLRHLEQHRQKKEKIYRTYEEGLKGLPVKMNPYEKCSEPNFWLSCLTIDKELVYSKGGAGKEWIYSNIANGRSVKDISHEEARGIGPIELAAFLDAANIETRPIWKPMHLQPIFADCDYVTAGDNTDEDIFARGLCLPSDVKMTDEEQTFVIEQIRKYFDMCR